MALETVLLAVGTEDTERATRLAETAVDSVAGTDATVVVSHAFTEVSFGDAVERLNYETGGEVVVDEVARRHETTRAVRDHLDGADVGYRIRGAVGEDRPDAVVDLAYEEDADRVIVGGRGRSPAGKAVFGSTAQRVLLRAPCPVTFVRDV